MTCTQNCQQGRACTCDRFPQITLEDEDRQLFTFETVADYTITALAGIGLFATIVFVGFLIGYAS